MLTRTARFFKLSTVIIVTIVFLTFAIVNRKSIELNLFPLPYSIQMPEFLFAVIWFVLGLIGGWILMTLKLSKSQRLLRAEHKHLMALQNEIDVLRSSKPTIISAALPRA